jgi:hypothetical protein
MILSATLSSWNLLQILIEGRCQVQQECLGIKVRLVLAVRDVVRNLASRLDTSYLHVGRRLREDGSEQLGRTGLSLCSDDR